MVANKHVLRLDVSVADSQMMRKGKSRGELSPHLEHTIGEYSALKSATALSNRRYITQMGHDHTRICKKIRHTHVQGSGELSHDLQQDMGNDSALECANCS